MVEQIRISPEEVRGYGNICEEHELDDFIVSSSGLAKEKETVHGALTEVYKLVYSLYGLIFDFDKGNKQLYLHSDYDVVVGFSFSEKSLVFNTVSHISFDFVDKNLVVDDEHYLFIDKGTIASHNDIWLLYNATLTRDDSYSTLLETTATGYAITNQDNKIPPNSVVEFDICQTDGTSNYAPIYIRNDGGGTSLSNINYNNLGASIGDWVHIKIVFNNTNTITVYSDKLSESFTKTLSATSTNYRVMLYCGGDMTTIKFKNFKAY